MAERRSIMKKIITLIMAMVMVLSSVTAFATNGGFVNSPSLNGTPAIKEFTNGSSSCTAEWIVTSYADRGTLSDEKKAEMEKAYGDIKGSANIEDLCSSLNGLAGPGKNLAVSDLFNLAYSDCDVHPEHGKTNFVVQASTLKDFKGLLCYNNNQWMLIDGATVDGDLLKFATENFTIFAIVVEVDAAAVDGPVDTGDSTRFFLYGAVMLASLAGVVTVVGMKARSKKEER